MNRTLCLLPVFIGALGGAMTSVSADEKCFDIERKKLCISESFRSGNIIEIDGLSRIKVLVGSSALLEKAAAYIERSENSRNDPGRTLFQRTMKDNPELIEELESNEEHTLYKSTASGRDNDYLFFSKISNEYFAFSCAFRKVCTIQGSFRGLLSVRLDFEIKSGSNPSLIELFGEFDKIKEKIIMEEV